MIFVVAFLALLFLKVLGVIAVSWWVVFIPLLVWPAIIIFIWVFAAIFTLFVFIVIWLLEFIGCKI